MQRIFAGILFQLASPFREFQLAASTARWDVSLSPRLLLCCFRVTAHCRKFFNSHLSAENETTCQTKNIVPTVWQRANNSPNFLISRFLFPLAKNQRKKSNRNASIRFHWHHMEKSFNYHSSKWKIFIFCQQNLNVLSSSYFINIFSSRVSMDRSILFDLFGIFSFRNIWICSITITFSIDLLTSGFRNVHIGPFPYRVQSIFIERPLIRACLDLPKLRTRKTRWSPSKFCWGRKAKRFDYRL